MRDTLDIIDRLLIKKDTSNLSLKPFSSFLKLDAGTDAAIGIRRQKHWG